MLKLVTLIPVIVLTILLSAFFAGAETGMYQLSRLRLRLGIERKQLSYILLGKAFRDSTGLLLAMLVGNSLTHYIVTSIVTYLLLTCLHAEHTAELSAALITTPTLFIFAELIPKNAFFYFADSLMPRCAVLLLIFHNLFRWCGAVGLLKLLSNLFVRWTGSSLPATTLISASHRSHFTAVLRDTQQENLLSSVQTNIINRLATISNTPLRSVMTPLSKTKMVPRNSTGAALLEKLKTSDATRLPVYDTRPGNIIGFINIYETLNRPRQFTKLDNFIHPIRKLSENTSVSEAITIMQTEARKIILVTRAGPTDREIPIGIATMKDLIEELLGELAEW